MARYPTGRAFIERLLLYGCPSAIGRLVISVVINAVYAVFFGWAWPHVRNKILERVPPSGTNFDSSSTVILPMWIFGIRAPLNHPSPNFIFRRICHAMCSAAGSGPFPMETPARCTVTAGQIYPRNVPIRAAFTNAAPIKRRIEAASDKFEHRQSSKFSPGEIDKSLAGVWPLRLQGYARRGGNGSVISLHE